jgi:hypothetical protein
MSQTHVLTDPTTESTPRSSVKQIARAFAPVAITLAVGIGCGILVEKMKNKSSDTTESA